MISNQNSSLIWKLDKIFNYPIIIVEQFYLLHQINDLLILILDTINSVYWATHQVYLIYTKYNEDYEKGKPVSY